MKKISTTLTPLYLICYVIYTTLIVTSASSAAAYSLPPPLMRTSGMYEGTLHHQRRHPVRNSFRISKRYALFDLDRAPYAPPTYLSANEARRTAKTNGPLFLLTAPPSLGYRKSPVSYYYCYDIEGSKTIFKKCILRHATNAPWGDSLKFVFNPSTDSVPKCEHISPFSDMLGKWRLNVSEPGEDLYAYISIEHPNFGNNYIIAYLKAKKVRNSSTSPDDLAAFFWLQPHKDSIITYWNVLKLWWKNAQYYEHPRKENPAYREGALTRNGKNVQFCPAFGGNNGANDVVQYGETIDRGFMWKDAPWPWSYLTAPKATST